MSSRGAVRGGGVEGCRGGGWRGGGVEGWRGGGGRDGGVRLCHNLLQLTCNA